jgi:hypothetical protein
VARALQQAGFNGIRPTPAAQDIRSHGARRMRLRSRSKLTRPYICRLSILIRFTVRKRAQPRQLIALYPVDPGGEALAVPAGHELGERGDMAGERLQVRAARQHLLAVEQLLSASA